MQACIICSGMKKKQRMVTLAEDVLKTQISVKEKKAKKLKFIQKCLFIIPNMLYIHGHNVKSYNCPNPITGLAGFYRTSIFTQLKKIKHIILLRLLTSNFLNIKFLFDI